MNILIANDDGIDSKGLLALVDALKDTYDLYVAAPISQRSAFSHSVTYFYQDNRAEERIIPGVKKAWAIDGTPSDCVYYGLCGLFDVKMDLIISGINIGRNLASDVVYSGTVAAAGEAMILGTPGMAVSLCSHKAEDFSAAADAAKKLIPVFMSCRNRSRFILNINVPAVKAEEIKGMKVTDLHDHVDYKRPVSLVHKEDGIYLTMNDNEMPDKPSTKQTITDVEAVEMGYIALTPLYYDMCASMYFDEMKEMEKL